MLMKWEILKGSEKDFEGVAEDVIYVLESLGSKFYSADMLVTKCGIAILESDKKYIIAERRPITDPSVNQQLTTEWDGDGLPPVGVECEFYDCEAWMKVRVKFVGEKYVALQDLKFDIERVYCVAEKPEKFRPIRSPEDAARANAFHDLVRLEKEMPDGYQTYDLLDAIVLAGYRKVE